MPSMWKITFYQALLLNKHTNKQPILIAVLFLVLVLHNFSFVLNFYFVGVT